MRIEYQGRGAPHAHLLIYLDKKSTERLYEDGYSLSAIIPDIYIEVESIIIVPPRPLDRIGGRYSI